MKFESVNVAPVRTPDGHVTVPEEVIHSMQKNKIGLKGQLHIVIIISHLSLVVELAMLGPLETQVGKGAVSLNLTLRRYILIRQELKLTITLNLFGP